MCEVEDLFFYLVASGLLDTPEDVLGSLVGRKITRTVWVARVHQIKFSYTMQHFCKFQLLELEAPNATLEGVYL